MLDPAAGWRLLERDGKPWPVREDPQSEPPALPAVGSWWWCEEDGLVDVVCLGESDVRGGGINLRKRNGLTLALYADDWPGPWKPAKVCCEKGHAYWKHGAWYYAMREQFNGRAPCIDDCEMVWMRPYMKACGRVLLPGGKVVRMVELEQAVQVLATYGTHVEIEDKHDKEHYIIGEHQLRALVGQPLGGGDGG